MAEVCGRRVTGIAAADVRSTNLGLESITGTIPAGCAPRVTFSQADGSAQSGVEFAQVRAFVADAVGSATAPAYPLSVVSVPTVSLTVTYTGAGALQGWVQGQWTTFGVLPPGVGRTVTVQVPSSMQGRTVNLRYHNAHIAEFDTIYHLTGDTVLRDRALAWLAYAPADEGDRASLMESVPINPDYAELPAT